MELISIHSLDVLLVVLGVSAGIATRYKYLAIGLRMLMLLAQMARWYLETHPEGKVMSKQPKIKANLAQIESAIPGASHLLCLGK